jgi:hypothetical protein
MTKPVINCPSTIPAAAVLDGTGAPLCINNKGESRDT